MNKRSALLLAAIAATGVMCWLSLRMAPVAQVDQHASAAVKQTNGTPVLSLLPASEKASLKTSAEVDESKQQPPLSAAATIIGSSFESDLQPECVAFLDWTKRYAANHDAALTSEGIRLAQIRRDFLASIIAKEPARVLADAVPWRIRKELPREIISLLETRVDAEGELWRMGVTLAPGHPVDQSNWTEALINNTSYRAYATGPDRSRSRARASLHGVAFGNQLALTDSPLRDIEVGEALAATRPLQAICPVSGKTTELSANEVTQTTNVVDAGTAYVRVCTESHKGRLERLVRSQEGKVSPWLNDEVNLADGGLSSPDPFLNTQPSLAWSTGTKKLLMVRIDFPDLPGTPINISAGSSPLTETSAVNIINRTSGVRDFYSQGSFSRTSISVAPVDGLGDSSDVTPVLRMPRAASYYALNGANTLLHSDARAAAAASGFNLADYDRIGVFFSWLGNLPGGSYISYAGLGNLEGPYFWINGYGSMSVVTHELGHTYGLPHSSRQQVAGSDPLSNSGSWEEYGDTLDVMGDGQDSRAQFNMWAKAFLHWIDPAAVRIITASGTYRVGSFDHLAANPANSALPLALRVARTAGVEYWIGHRGAFNATNTYTANGAYIQWARSDGNNPRLIDCNSPADNVADNAPLQVGQSLVDAAEGITIKTLAHGGSGASEWLDIQVSFDSHLELVSPVPVADERHGPFNLLLLRGTSSSSSINGTWSTASGTAITGNDFTQTNGSLSWEAGNSSPSLLTIPITNDAIEDDNESFTIALQNIKGAVASSGVNPITVLIKQPGAIDTTFRNTRAQSLPPISSSVLVATPDTRGNLLIGGWFLDFGAQKLDYLARLLPDGDEDLTFLPTSISSTAGPVLAIATNATGSIFVGGGFTSANGPQRLQKLTATGALDGTFNIGTGPNNDVYALHVQTDGKLIVAGIFTSFNGTPRNGIVRLNTDGSIDTAFDDPTLDGNLTPFIYCLALQPDGKIIIGGNFLASATAPYQGGVARLNDDGTIDHTFNPGDGTASSSVGTWGAVNAVAVLSSGKIAVGGLFGIFDGLQRDHLAILSSSGALDTGPLVQVNGTVKALLALPDGSLVAGGAFDATVPVSVGLSRVVHLLANGTLDTSFNTSSSEVNTSVEALVLDPESRRIFAAGNICALPQSIGGNSVFRLMSGLAPVPPVITQQPVATSADENTNFTITVLTNAQRAWCQWFRDGVAVPGATTTTFTSIASRTDNGQWRAQLTTPYGVLTSDLATVLVRYKPIVTMQPVNLRVNNGAPASFTVVAKGGTLTYQWQHNNADINGATSATLDLSPATVADAGSYQCVVTNALGTATSTSVALIVVAAPTITMHPDDAVLLVGQSTTLVTTANGLFLSYQWRKDNVNIANATTSTYTLSKVSTARAGSYTCVVSNSAGNATTNPAHVHVVVKPAISTQPIAQLRPATGSVTISVAATGEFLSYQWQKDSVNIAFATGSSYTRAPLNTGDKGSYRCLVSNIAGSVTSNAAALAIYEAPTIVTQPQPQLNVPRGSPRTFSVAASGLFLMYQWQLNTIDIPSATSSTLNIAYPDTANEGTYRCLVSNLAGTATSNSVALSVMQPPSITTQPTSHTLTSGQPASFTIVATGDALTYQWQRNRANITGATNSTFEIASITDTDAGSYRCIVSNAAGKATSTDAALIIGSLPVITQQPLNVAAEAGANVTLTIAATGNGLTYQWKRNGVNVSSTSASINFAAFNAMNAGSYSCVVTNTSGSITSRTAVLAIATYLGSSTDDSTRKWQSISPAAHWSNQSQTTHDHTDALQTPALLDGESCVLKTTVTGPVLIRFWRKVSSQSGSDFFRYTVDGLADADVPDVSGEVDWQECLSLIPAGSHELIWTYQKDVAGFYGSDAAWIDQFSTGIPAYITTQPANVLALAGSTAHFEVAVRTLGTTYQWKRNTVSISGATTSTLDVTASTAGDYTVLIGGKITSSIAKLCVATPSAAERVATSTTATLSLSLSGTSFTGYQWLSPDTSPVINDLRITGATTSKLLVGNVSNADVGSYTCRVSAFTPTQTIDVAPCILGIVTQPVVDASDPPIGIVSGNFAWQLSATQFPLSFTITGLPKGLKYNTASGYVSGLPEVSGTFSVQVFARNGPFQSFARSYLLTVSAFPVGATGSFSALVARDTTNDNLGGLLTLTVTSLGNYTGTLKQGSKSYPLSGRTTAQLGGAVSLTTSYTSTAGVAKNLVINFDTANDTLAGSINSDSLIEGARHQWTSIKTASTFAGSFNCSQQISAAQQGNAALPHGTGYTQLTVTSLGTASVSGKLADGTAFISSATMWPGGRVPLFLMLYSNHGSLTGTHNINAGIVTGALSWSKNAGASTTSYPDGFTEVVNFDTDGAAWVQASPVLGLGNASIKFFEGGISGAVQAGSLNQTFTITSSNFAQFIAASNPTSVTLSLNATTGLFTGSFTLTDPVNIKRTATICGVLLSHRSEGRGHFTLRELVGTKVLSGRVVIATP